MDNENKNINGIAISKGVRRLDVSKVNNRPVFNSIERNRFKNHTLLEHQHVRDMGYNANGNYVPTITSSIAERHSVSEMRSNIALGKRVDNNRKKFK